MGRQTSRGAWPGLGATSRTREPEFRYDVRRQFGNCKPVAPSRLRQAGCAMSANGKRHVPPLRPETAYGAIEQGRRDRKRIEPRCREFRGSSNPNSSRWVIPRLPSSCHAKGGPILNKSGQVKSRQIPTSGEKRAPEAKPGQNVSQRAPSAWAAGAVLTGISVYPLVRSQAACD
jgi:hypothetical protein